MRLRSSFVLLPIFSVLVSAASVNSVDVTKILRDADEARLPLGMISFQAKIKDYKNGDLDSDTEYHVSTKDGLFSRVETIAPERMRGRKLLMRENDLWFYLPSIKRPTRVSFQQKLTGEIANGDIAKTQYSKDYTPKLLAIETLSGKTTYKLELVAKTRDVTYGRILYWVEANTSFPMKAEFYAISGKLLKTGEYFDFLPVLGKKRTTRLLIKDALHPSTKSEMIYSNFKTEQLDESIFNKESLAE